ncbi:MAG TPA: hypothetical protein VGQ29_13330 [Gemmatimonadales bacterium]|jgi:hypothetical protein|nr:hypothetical protein [Gemmatimonadales bacterium]
MKAQSEFRDLLRGGDRRSIADSARVRALVEQRPARVKQLAALTADEDWLVSQRALDLLEKLAHEHPEWVEPHKQAFIGPLADSDKWEIRLQIVRALPLFRWTAAEARRVEAILTRDVAFPQTFVRAWALDSLATLSRRKPRLAPLVMRHLAEFEQSSSKALQARARAIRERLVRS